MSFRQWWANQDSQNQRPDSYRHPILVFLLFLIFTANIAILFTLPEIVHKFSIVGKTSQFFSVFGILAIINILFIVALCRWKKWGFYGLCASALIILGINIYLDVPILRALSSLVTIIFLYGALHLGGKDKAWHKLT